MLKINFSDKVAFVAGVSDDKCFGWGIAKALAEAGASIAIGIWPPMMRIFEKSLTRGLFDNSRQLSNGGFLNFAGIYPLDVGFEIPEDVPDELRKNKRYSSTSRYSIKEVVEDIKSDFGSVDFFVHSIANAPSINQTILETPKDSFLKAMDISMFSFISLARQLSVFMNPEGAMVTISYLAADKVIPHYGGGMSTAKAALQNAVRELAFLLGKKTIRVNSVSPGPCPSRAAKAIGNGEFIEKMVNYSKYNSPLKNDVCIEDVGNSVAVVLSDYMRLVTGQNIYLDNGLHSMGVSLDSRFFDDLKGL